MKQVIKKIIKEAHNIDDTPLIYTLLLDMNSIMKMSLVNKKVNNNGEEIGMIFTTLMVIRNLLSKKDFNFCYAIYDGDKSGELRAYLYPEYKANRDKHYDSEPQSEYEKEVRKFVKRGMAYQQGIKAVEKLKRQETEDEIFQRQREIIFKCLEELFVRQIMCDKIEGDDLIAYYVKNKKPNERIVIVSGDRDLVQLLSKDICLYETKLKKFITIDNCVKELGYRHDNVVLKKIICGDSSDNIIGIKGMGEVTLNKLFPQILTEKCTLNSILEHSKILLEERKAEKKKPLKTLENLLNKVTTGSQGENIFEINKKIIDLSEPFLTLEAKNEIDNMMYAPLDQDGRDYKNLYQLIIDNDIQDLIDSEKFGTFFAPFGKLIDNEKKYKGD